jgi:hypothetical protein
MIGEMMCRTVLTLIVIPAVSALWTEHELVRVARRTPSPMRVRDSPLTDPLA